LPNKKRARNAAAPTAFAFRGSFSMSRDISDSYASRLANIEAQITSAQRRFIQHVRPEQLDFRRFRCAKADLERARYYFDNLMIKWAEKHPPIGTGYCPTCQHYGEDCTGGKS
jgi:hypothetical protein